MRTRGSWFCLVLECEMKRIRYLTSLAVLVFAFSTNAQAQPPFDWVPPPLLDVVVPDETDRPAPVDYGAGPGRPLDTSQQPLQTMALSPLETTAAIPAGAADAHTKGVFAPAVTWPIIPIHAVLLPDGRVMSYGTGEQGQQGAQFVYDVWDPAAGAHTVLPNTTSTDVFCAGQTIAGGEVFMFGGDQTVNGKRNFSNQQTTVFSPTTNTIRSEVSMLYPRWYASAVVLASGSILVVGGREEPGVPATTPEVFAPGVGWRTLTGSTSTAAYGGISANWYYPRSFLAPNGRVFVLGNDGKTFYLESSGAGAITQQIATAPGGSNTLPSVMFAPGKVLSLRNLQKAIVINLNGATPTVSATAPVDQIRIWSTATVLADGKVLVTGGSAVANQLSGVAYAATTWNPATGQWTPGARAVKPRLYHSTAMLLPSGAVLTGGGGAPGPVKNLNAELYYPGYLYDASGQPAARPSIVTAPTQIKPQVSTQFSATVGPAQTIGRVTLVRTGAVTHAFDPSQRFLQLGFTQSGQTLTVTLPTKNRNVVVPGYYMLFAFDQAGVPSVAKIVRIS
jgi:hypothetical protein